MHFDFDDCLFHHARQVLKEGGVENKFLVVEFSTGISTYFIPELRVNAIL